MDKNLDKVRFIEVNSMPTLEEYLKQKLYVNQPVSNFVDESSLLRLDPDEKLKLDEQYSKLLNCTLTLPKMIIEKPNKSFVDKKFNNTSLIKNTAYVDFNDKKLDNVRFVKVYSMPAVGEHFTANSCVDNPTFSNVNESSLLRLDPNAKIKLNEQNSIFLNSILTSPKTIIEIPTKSYVDSLHEINRTR